MVLRCCGFWYSRCYQALAVGSTLIYAIYIYIHTHTLIMYKLIASISEGKVGQGMGRGRHVKFIWEIWIHDQALLLQTWQNYIYIYIYI